MHILILDFYNLYRLPDFRKILNMFFDLFPYNLPEVAILNAELGDLPIGLDPIELFEYIT